MVADVASVRTEGPYAVRITLTQKNSTFLDYLASAYGPVMESPTALAAHAGKDHDQTYLQTHDVGTGPYTLTEAKVGVAYQLKAFPGYWGKKPYFTTVDLPVIDDLSSEEIQFNDGQIAAILHDLTAPAITSYEHNKSVDLFTLPTLESEVVYVNEHQGFLTSQAARLATLEAIDLKAIDAAVFPDGAIVPPQFGPAHVLPAGVGKQTIAYDTKALRTLVGKLAFSQRTLTVGYDTGAPDDQLIAENVAAELQADGLTTKVVGYETSEIFGWVGSVRDAASQAPNILVDYFWPDADNPYTWTHISYDPSGGLEYLSCQARGVAALDSQAVASGSTSLYGEVVAAAQKTGCWLNVADHDDVMVAQRG
ncbi:MAG TPA: ABC transporter substrate-binding protein [Acidimicrobiales bacterium]|nr:ABC transporter substrate-binding protein [Acidimicrobiales bacterium]